MRKLAIAVLGMMSATAGAADDWWEKSTSGLPELVALGYAVVGFSATPESNRVFSNVVAFRYVLQRVNEDGSRDVASCTEKFAGDNAIVTNCYELRRIG